MENTYLKDYCDDKEIRYYMLKEYSGHIDYEYVGCLNFNHNFYLKDLYKSDYDFVILSTSCLTYYNRKKCIEYQLIEFQNYVEYVYIPYIKIAIKINQEECKESTEIQPIQENTSNKKIICFNCHRIGHVCQACPKASKKDKKRFHSIMQFYVKQKGYLGSLDKRKCKKCTAEKKCKKCQKYLFNKNPPKIHRPKPKRKNNLKK